MPTRKTTTLVLLLVLAQAAFIFAIRLPFAGYTAFHDTPHIEQKKPNTKAANGLTLRHVFHHGAGQPGPRARRLDITAERVFMAQEAGQYGPFPIKMAPVKIERPASRMYDAQIPMSPIWVAEDIPGPDVEDKDTVINFAYMSEDAYKEGRNDPEWLDVDDQYNASIPFGWDDSGVRGHVFSDDTNSTIILAVKGTTVAMFEGNGTSGHDKENDNLFGSCCCGQGGSYLWRKVCDCQTGTYTCDQTCVSHEMRKPNRYYSATLELYEEVTKLYPNANIITAGHSLGGVLASLIGLQHGVPSVTFETYPQALAARRLGLPTAGDITPLRKNTGGFHFGHTADPVYMGSCSGTSSFCSIGGYAFETVCHTGKRCAYDVVKDKGWRQSTSTHRLRYAIDNVYKVYDKPATCVDEDVNCVDCYLWKFENGTHSKPSTTTATAPTVTSTRTRTETCKTPGWWGCRDESTTATGSTSTSTSSTSISTSTCETPGWFGCKDKTSTTAATTTTTPSSEPTTTTCTSKGWFGKCLDDAPATTTPAMAGHAMWRPAQTAVQTTA
jgi:lipase ATG15